MSSTAATDETALITGASSGIGYELTDLFAADGFDVVLVARREERLESIAEDLEAEYGISAEVRPRDLSEPDAARELYEAVTDDGLTVDALVNNAGFGVYGEFVDTDLEQELDMLTLHVITTTVLTKLFGREMAERGHGYVLNTASITGFVPLPTSAVYSAAKHYQRSLSEALAEELVDEGVTVTALCPGTTDTGFMETGNFEETAYTEKDLMDPATVARAGYEGLMDGDRIVVPGWKNKASVFARRVTPRTLYVKAAEWVQTD